MSLDVERVVMIVNPTAGGGRAGRVWNRLLDEAPELAGARQVLANGAADARRALAEHLDDGIDAVVAVGGDGTAHTVVNELFERRQAERVAFGLIPAGTGSDLARCLGLPRRPADNWRRVRERLLRKTPPRTIDVLEVTTDAGASRVVINIASTGVSGVIVDEVNAIADRGQLTYLWSTLKALWRYEPVPCRVVVDGAELYDGGFFVVAVANGRSFGRGMHVAPEAAVDDGLADVVVIAPLPLWQLPYRLPRLYAGTHLELPFVRWKRGHTVRIEPHGALPPYELDGEKLDSAAATIRVRPNALRLLA